MHQDFWFETAKLFRLSPALRRTHLLTGSVNGLIDAALCDETDAWFLIEASSGGMLVGREIARAACDLTRPARADPCAPEWRLSGLPSLEPLASDESEDAEG